MSAPVTRLTSVIESYGKLIAACALRMDSSFGPDMKQNALTYRVTVDVPARFRNSKAVGAVFGLTPAKYQSGESDRPGAISRCGDEMMRMMLYEAAQSMLVRSTKCSWLKAWAMKIARHRGMKKAIVALARRLAVIMHRIWVDGTDFRWTREVAAAKRSASP
jgi:transposase